MQSIKVISETALLNSDVVEKSLTIRLCVFRPIISLILEENSDKTLPSYYLLTLEQIHLFLQRSSFCLRSQRKAFLTSRHSDLHG